MKMTWCRERPQRPLTLVACLSGSGRSGRRSEAGGDAGEAPVRTAINRKPQRPFNCLEAGLFAKGVDNHRTVDQ
jgi:hypothetical protein